MVIAAKHKNRLCDYKEMNSHLKHVDRHTGVRDFI